MKGILIIKALIYDPQFHQNVITFYIKHDHTSINISIKELIQYIHPTSLLNNPKIMIIDEICHKYIS